MGATSVVWISDLPVAEPPHSIERALGECVGRSALMVRIVFEAPEPFSERLGQGPTSDVRPLCRHPQMSPSRMAWLDEVGALPEGALAFEQSDGSLAVLLRNDDGSAAGWLERLRDADRSIEVASVRVPRDGGSFRALWQRLCTEADPSGMPGIIVVEPAMERIFDLARRLAQTTTTVLILGETGVGKEVVAEMIHRNSARRDRPFIRINCGSLPETLIESELFGYEKGAFTGADRRKIGHIEAANGGTLFLDEVGELSPSMQVKLLRVLESRQMLRLGNTKEIPIDLRVICATHRDLEFDVSTRRFRRDLFYRISTFTLQVPALRDRPNEIAVLARSFAHRFAKEMSKTPPEIEPEALSVLMRHSWPGNIRELRNAIEHAVVLVEGDRIGACHLPPTVRRCAEAMTRSTDPLEGAGSRAAVRGPIARQEWAEIERKNIESALLQFAGNRTHAARALGISRRTLLYRLAKYRVSGAE